jgi:hypothetical protein
MLASRIDSRIRLRADAVRLSRKGSEIHRALK